MALDAAGRECAGRRYGADETPTILRREVADESRR